MIELMEFAAGWVAKGAFSTEIAPMEGSFLTLMVTNKAGKRFRFVVRPDAPPASVDAIVLKWLEGE